MRRIQDLITTDEHALYQGLELHFYFTLTCPSASLFDVHLDWGIQCVSSYPIYLVLYQIAFVTVNMFRLGSDAALSAALAEMQLGCVV